MEIKRTDWDRYYARPYVTARYSARIVNNNYLSLIKKYRGADRLIIAELGGGDSGVYPLVDAELPSTRMAKAPE